MSENVRNFADTCQNHIVRITIARSDSKDMTLCALTIVAGYCFEVLCQKNRKNFLDISLLHVII